MSNGALAEVSVGNDGVIGAGGVPLPTGDDRYGFPIPTRKPRKLDGIQTGRVPQESVEFILHRRGDESDGDIALRTAETLVKERTERRHERAMYEGYLKEYRRDRNAVKDENIRTRAALQGAVNERDAYGTLMERAKEALEERTRKASEEMEAATSVAWHGGHLEGFREGFRKGTLRAYGRAVAVACVLASIAVIVTMGWIR